MIRQFQTRLALRIEAPNSAAEGLLRGQEEFLAVPRVGLRTAAQNDDVPRGALGGFDGAKSILVAALGYVTDQDESAGRALGAGRLEEAERFPEAITAARFSVSWDSSAAPYSERTLQGQHGRSHHLCLQGRPWLLRPRRSGAPIPACAPAPAVEHGAHARAGGGGLSS